MNGTHIAPQVDLRFECRAGGGTFLARQYAGYPFHVGRILRRPDAPASAATVLIQSCSGGLFEHDRVAARVKVCAGAGARVGNAAATVVHSMTGGEAVSKVLLEAEPDAWLEYAPALTILFPGARLVNSVDVVLHQKSLVILADSFLAHDPSAQAKPFDALDTCLAVHDETGRILVRDRVRLDGVLWGGAAAGVSASFRAHGSFAVLQRDADAVELTSVLHAAIGEQKGVYAGVGALPNRCGVLVRVLADSGEPLRQALLRVTEAMREVFGHRAAVPDADAMPAV